MDRAHQRLCRLGAVHVHPGCDPLAHQEAPTPLIPLLVCPILDKFVADCQAAINDEGRYRNGNRLPSVPMPTEPEFPAEIDWTSINAAMAYRILSLRAATARVDHELRYVEEELHDPPENEPWLSYRRKRCLQLASEASDLSTDLRPSPKLAPEARTAATGSRQSVELRPARCQLAQRRPQIEWRPSIEGGLRRSRRSDRAPRTPNRHGVALAAPSRSSSRLPRATPPKGLTVLRGCSRS